MEDAEPFEQPNEQLPRIPDSGFASALLLFLLAGATYIVMSVLTDDDGLVALSGAVISVAGMWVFAVAIRLYSSTRKIRTAVKNQRMSGAEENVEQR